MASKRVIPTISKAAVSSLAVQTAPQAKARSPLPSPSHQPSITLKELKDIRDDLRDDVAVIIKSVQNSLQDSLANSVKALTGQYNELKEDILQAFEGVVANTERIEGRVDEISEKVEKLEERSEKMDENVEINQNDITMVQYRKMEFALRIRGLREEVKENFREEIAADLAVALECEPDEILRDIENFFRVNSWVARQKNLPRDVVIYFSRRAQRNEIIQAFYQRRFQIAAQDVLILKEIPPKILRKRKDYAFLSEELKKRSIPFRWDIPSGIILNYEGTRYRLNSILKARDFYASVLKAGSPSSPRRKRAEDMSADAPAGEAGGMTLLTGGELQLESKDLKEDPKGQRMTRAAYRRREKEQQLQVVTTPIYEITSEPVGGTRPKKSLMQDIRGMFQRLDASKDGKTPDLEC